MISAYEHGRNAARHGKHIQACPFDFGTTQWREWRSGFIAALSARATSGEAARQAGPDAPAPRCRAPRPHPTPCSGLSKKTGSHVLHHLRPRSRS